MGIRLYNTMTRRLEAFEPLKEGEVSIYCCGPTVYDLIGIHNARTFVSLDLARRYLEYRGYRVSYVQNITDIDDKIIARANERGSDPLEWAQKYAQAYQDDMKALGVKPPSEQPRAMETLEEMIDMIAALEKMGAAYETSSGVYFSIASFERYGCLSGRNLDELRTGARVNVDEEKRDPRDFALWKRAKPGEPEWDSPWGKGRPGWHIECSAMARKHLGNTVDIHAAGEDLIFPHHENEIAQSEKANGEPLARYWMHGALMRIGGQRMGKSLGNFIPAREALERYPVAALRLFYASTHYRKPLDFTEEAIERQIAPMRRLNRCIDALEAAAEAAPSNGQTRSEAADAFHAALRRAEAAFIETVDDDFNFPGGLGVLFEFARTANRFLAEGGADEQGAKQILDDAQRWMNAAAGELLGVRESGAKQTDETDARLENALKAALNWRAQAREQRDWTTADAIRGGLEESGVSVTDSKEGASWELQEDAAANAAAERAVELLAELRAEARARKDWAAADAIRDALSEAGVSLTDLPSGGAEWSWD
ncbi:MAG: cysteine--tRNA ligase [Candidatus Poribacteria bacterium]|nr:cysteine--tRNA ligase [Candidatus Poribacteria bacterium]